MMIVGFVGLVRVMLKQLDDQVDVERLRRYRNADCSRHLLIVDCVELQRLAQFVGLVEAES